MKNRPNLLVISTDQQFAGAMTCEGVSSLHTPAMDSLAASGVRFSKAYCSQPICVPSRTSYMTGLMPHETGVTFNIDQCPVNAPCGAALFREAGYDTGYVGKWHIPRDIHDTNWSGFNFLAQIRNNSVDFEIPEPCLEFIHKKRNGPFLLFASFVNPHDICEWARIASGREDRLKNADIPHPPPAAQCPPLPDNLEIPEKEPTAIRENQHHPATGGLYPARDWGKESDGIWRQYRWMYYRMVESVDQQIGKILDGLKKSGQYENTVILFTSDHGDGMGAHRWNQKNLFYDECARVPFIISMNEIEKSGSVESKRLVNLGLDLFPTLYDFAGIPQPDYMRGISLRPFVDSTAGKPAYHDYVVAETDLHTENNKSGGIYGRMARTNRYKYSRFSQGAICEQFIDMENDPGEMLNLIDDPAYFSELQHHRRLLDDWVRRTEDTLTTPA